MLLLCYVKISLDYSFKSILRGHFKSIELIVRFIGNSYRDLSMTVTVNELAYLFNCI